MDNANSGLFTKARELKGNRCAFGWRTAYIVPFDFNFSRGANADKDADLFQRIAVIIFRDKDDSSAILRVYPSGIDPPRSDTFYGG